MRYDWKHLEGEEKEVFLQMQKKYTDYDKVDFLIHKTLKSLGIPLEEFNKRKKKSKFYENYAIHPVFTTENEYSS